MFKYMNETVNQRVRVLRTALNLTQNEFAKRINVNVTTINRIENGESKPQPVTLNAILKEFNVNQLWLNSGIGEMFANNMQESSTEIKETKWKDIALQLAQERITHLESLVDKLIVRIPIAKEPFKTGIDEKGNFENCVNTVRVA